MSEPQVGLQATFPVSEAIRALWEVVKIGDLFSIQQGKAVSKKHRRGISPRPFLRTGNVLWGRLDLSTLDQMDFTPAEEERYALLPRDLLVCEGGDIGRTAMWQDEIDHCYYQNHIHRLRALDAETVPRFYMYWMNAGIRQLGLYEGAGNRTTIANLSMSRLAAFEVPHPSPGDQSRIASALHVAQKMVHASEALRQAREDLFESLLNGTMTGSISADTLDVDAP